MSVTTEIGHNRHSIFDRGVIWTIIGLLGLLVISTAAIANQLVVGLSDSPERLIPIKIKNPQTFPVSMQIFEGLVDTDENGKVIPRIMERWETTDQKVWVFHLQKGIHFHRSAIFENGTRDVNSLDVVYSLTRHCSADAYNAFLLTDSIKGASAYNQGKAESVEGIQAMDERTVRIELVKPEPFFINRLSTAWITVFPKEIDKIEFKDDSGLEFAVGTGPYQLASRTETEVVLEKNPFYWDQKNQPEIDRLVFHVIKNDQIRVANLKQGKLDFIAVPIGQYDSIFNKDKTLKSTLAQRYKIKAISTYNTHFIGINNKNISDVNLRRAMFWGTNRKEIIDNLLYGFAEETMGTIPPGLNGYKPMDIGNLYNPQKAKVYLAKSAYKGEPIELYSYDNADAEAIAQIFQAQMGVIGIQIKIIKIDFAAALERMVKGESPMFNMFFEYVFSSPEPILINLFSSSKIPVPNFFQFSDPEIDQKLISLYSLPDAFERIKKCKEIEADIMEKAPSIFLYRGKYLMLMTKKLNGLEISGNNHIFFEKARLTN